MGFLWFKKQTFSRRRNLNVFRRVDGGGGGEGDKVIERCSNIVCTFYVNSIILNENRSESWISCRIDGRLFGSNRKVTCVKILMNNLVLVQIHLESNTRSFIFLSYFNFRIYFSNTCYYIIILYYIYNIY